jgi:hypothetical protein
MALVHHSLIQFSAFRVGLFPFWNYRVLGDDVVIGGQSVAESYQVVCEALGVPISIPKSLMSKNGFFDFASQILKKTTNYSPISLREELAAQRPGRRIEFALRSVRRGLLDFTKPGWFSEFLKFVVPRSVYSDIVEARRVGMIDPAAKVVLMELLGTLELALGRAGLQLPKVSCWAYFVGLSRPSTAFRESFITLLGLGDPRQINAAKELTLEALAYKARFVYRKYLKLRTTIEKWESVIGPERALTLDRIRELCPEEAPYMAPPLLVLGSFVKKIDAFRAWETEYRRLLKTVDVTTRLRPMPIELFEFTLEKSLQECWDLVSAADDELLVNPEILFGEIVLPEEINILLPSTSESSSFQKSISRLGLWQGLWTMSQKFQVPSLGLPGPTID